MAMGHAHQDLIPPLAAVLARNTPWDSALLCVDPAWHPRVAFDKKRIGFSPRSPRQQTCTRGGRPGTGAPTLAKRARSAGDRADLRSGASPSAISG